MVSICPTLTSRLTHGEAVSKLRQVNLKNFLHFVPAWGFNAHAAAQSIDAGLDALAQQRGKKSLKGSERTFWIEINAHNGTMRVAEPDGGAGDENVGVILIDCASPMGGDCQVLIPMACILKGEDDLRGTHSLYMHEMQGDARVLCYVGITKQRWFDRLSQHVSSANCGSRLVFHDAIRRNQEARKKHSILYAGLSHDEALDQEERWVEDVSLYPHGLNMIPGGKAGFTYLAGLGLSARDAAERDAVIERIVERDTIEGKPNPLCAARWASDQDYVNRVICNHPSRLSVDQVRDIRLLGSFGKSADDIADRLDIGAVSKVRNVLRGYRYSRVA